MYKKQSKLIIKILLQVVKDWPGDKQYGPLGIYPNVIDYVNKLLGQNQYHYDDCQNTAKSIEICLIYLDHKLKKAPLRGMSNYFFVEIAAREWSKRPKGSRRHPYTAAYIYLAKQVLKAL